MTHRQKEQDGLYDHYCRIYPLKLNPDYDRARMSSEVLVTCRCGAGYRVLVNCEPEEIIKAVGTIPLHCGNCGLPATEAPIFSTHSAGVFNFAIVRPIGLQKDVI